jgi:hypothetical protein
LAGAANYEDGVSNALKSRRESHRRFKNTAPRRGHILFLPACRKCLLHNRFPSPAPRIRAKSLLQQKDSCAKTQGSHARKALRHWGLCERRKFMSSNNRNEQIFLTAL